MGINPRRFLWPLPEHLLCPSCKTTLDDAAYICEGRHIFCSPCLIEKGYCGKCEGSALCFKSATEIIEELGEYWVRCIDPKCSWAGPLKDEKAHCSACEFRLVLCELCGHPMRHNERADHLSKTCPETRTVCERGGENCGGVGRGIFYRKDSAIHDSVCAKFACRIPGCPTRTSLADLTAHESTCFAIRRGIVSCHQSALGHQNDAKIHHANASLLTNLLSELPLTSFKSKSDQDLVVKAKSLYPRPLEYPVSSEYLLRSLPPQVPITPITPAQSTGGGGAGGFDSQHGFNSIHPSSDRSMSQPASSASLAAGLSHGSVEVESPGLDLANEEGEEGSALKKRKLGKVGTGELKEEPSRQVSFSA
ncbi:hypothetical protein JCM5350_000759 [Sporobolomyces pararoseus]